MGMEGLQGDQTLRPVSSAEGQTTCEKHAGTGDLGRGGRECGVCKDEETLLGRTGLCV